MLIEVVALEPSHYDEGVVTIHFKKLLTGEAGEVNSVHAVFAGGFKQEKPCYRAKCAKSFHGHIPLSCLTHVGRHGQDGRVKPLPGTWAAAPQSGLAIRRSAIRSSIADCCMPRAATRPRRSQA